MSDKEENSLEPQDTKTAYRNEGKNKAISLAKLTFNKTDAPIVEESDLPASKSESEIPKTESAGDNNSMEEDISFPKAPRVRYTKQPALGGMPSGRGKFFLWFAILILAIALILVAAGGAYYAQSFAQKEQGAREALSKELLDQVNKQIKQRITTEVEAHLSKKEDLIQQEVTHLKDESTKTSASLKIIREEVAALESNLRAIRKEPGKTSKSEDWDIAEAAYLLRIANERLHLEEDVKTAITALQMADQIIHHASDPALISVRATLTEEINALKAIPIPDIDGMVLSLNSLIGRVKELKLKEIILDQSAPKSTTDKDRTAKSDSNDYAGKAKEFLYTIWSDLQHLVVVKQRDKKEGGALILLPKERYFLYQNLRFELEIARLSLLQKNEGGFRQSLRQAKNWLQDYFQGAESEAMGNTLTKLEKIVIKPPLPDISQSLKILNDLRSQTGIQPTIDHKGGEA
ncbi:hypothetical conserved protein [Candidatus Nitrosoglobus terrae]|uniref:Hypothetical conserved protein n=1 Tax=Candidatus Nitrosoglobus terrae TaxID=1630141 RepID=A0A1Q2SPV7_9GAMM|nr:uroporphyrinogen-III C-methyltransferase [Candidatus Nitrosoglobus terrae]BAW81185.1 hypothetical conserved protein [Candidatus Nitrosoglobus terrae]